MFRLSPAPDPANDGGPVWIDPLPGVRIKLRPVEPTPLLLAARRAGALAHAAGKPATDVEFAFTVAAACWGALDWEGVGGEEGDEPLPLTADNLARFLAQSPEAYDAIDARYVTPALLAEQEKNGSSPSPNGTSTGAKATAGNAPGSAPSARTGRTKPAPKRAPASGA